MFRICFESLASVVPIKWVRAAHCDIPYVHGQLWEKNDWQFSNPRIDTADTDSKSDSDKVDSQFDVDIE